jgi:hypothetical protein
LIIDSLKYGRFRNPLKETFPSGSPIEEGEMKEFHKKRDEMMTWMNEDATYSRRLEDITSDALQKNWIN